MGPRVALYSGHADGSWQGLKRLFQSGNQAGGHVVTVCSEKSLHSEPLWRRPELQRLIKRLAANEFDWLFVHPPGCGDGGPILRIQSAQIVRNDWTLDWPVIEERAFQGRGIE